MESADSASTETGTPTKRNDTINLSDHALVVVFEGVKVLEHGPYKGERVVRPAKIYIEGKQIGVLSSFRLTQNGDNPLPEVSFAFASGLKDEDIPTMSDRLKATLSGFVGLIRKNLPWATWSMPGASSPPPASVTVFDPGQVKPTTPVQKG